jgi:hypothetical protein
MDTGSRTRDYVEATLSAAKMATFLVSAEDGVQRRDLGSAAFCAYSTLLHLSLTLQWLLADQLPAADLERLVELRRGGGVATSGSGRARAQQFLCNGPLQLENGVALCALLDRTRAQWEYYAEGPAVAWSGVQPTVASAAPSAMDIIQVVRRLRAEMTAVLRSSRRSAALSGMALTIVLRQSIEYMRGPRYPFAGWTSPAIHNEAVGFLESLRQEMSSM